MIRRERTEHGFKFGAAEVTCICADEAKGWAIIGLKTPKFDLQIYTTKTGKVRIFNSGREVYLSAAPTPEEP